MFATTQPGPVDFEAIVREHQGMVFRTLQRLTNDAARVEDLAQEVFLRLYRGLPHFQGDAKLSTYLYRITLNVAQDEWKRRRKERSFRATPVFDPDQDAPAWIETLPASAPNAEQDLAARELLDQVNEALLHLPEAERSVLVLYHQQECSYEHIALTLNLPLNTVRTHLRRGRQRLAQLLRPKPVPAPAGAHPVSRRPEPCPTAR